MAIKELFYDQRPIALLDPRASNRLDPRFTFTRNSKGTFIDSTGLIKTAESNIPRITYDNNTRELDGLLLERASTNIVQNSTSFAECTSFTKATSPAMDPMGGFAATRYTRFSTIPTTLAQTIGPAQSTGPITASCFVKPGTRPLLNFLLRNSTTATDYAHTPITASTQPYARTQISSVGPTYSTYEAYPNGWFRVSLTVISGFSSGNVIAFYLGETGGVDNESQINTYHDVFGMQVEHGEYATSYIPTSGAAVTRAADLISISSLSIPSSGSIYIDARPLTARADDTLISLKNASNQKINLAFNSNSATYNSLALISSYSGTSKASLPLPVPSTNRERNIITWGAQNYQYTKDSSRFAPSLSASVPANLISLSIGHDSVDATKAFNGHINNVYMWSGELAPAVAEALVRNDLNPVNADTYSPVGPSGSLALVINTQGASTSGNKVFALPAESVANNNNLTITWGDGTESALELVAAEVGATGLSHTYPAAGIYPVWVEGKMQNLYFNNSASAPDLLRVAAWGTGQMFTSPSTMDSAFYGCSNLQSMSNSGVPNTSAVTNWASAFRNCSSLTGTFPSFDFSGATSFYATFAGCSSLTSFPALANQTQNVTNFTTAWLDCSALSSFPLINTAAGTTFEGAWRGCTSLTSFPLLNTAAGTNFTTAWMECYGLTSFPLINTAAATTFNGAWLSCTGLVSFPLINTSVGILFRFAWYGCHSLTSFPLINTAAGTDFYATWYNCSSLTTFPLINTALGTDFSYTWYACGNLTSFPAINTGSALYLTGTWQSCSSLTSFPLIDTSKVISFAATWATCASLTSFPSINTAAGTNFYASWYECSSLTSFPALTFDASVVGTASDTANPTSGFYATWMGCTSLTTFPANLFNSVTNCNRFLDAFRNCALTAASIENIIVSINAAGTSNGNLGLQGGTNAGASTWTANAVTAYNALVARGWTITRNA